MAAFGTYEWAVKNYNIVSGCSHDCKYCYSKEMAIRFKRKKPETWKNEEKLKGAENHTFPKINGQIMFPSSHDITPDNISDSMRIIEQILSGGNKLLIVSKPHMSCISLICNNLKKYKQNILFRFSIGSSNNSTLAFWEPNAPLFEERLESLKFAYNAGFKTSISCEPMLDDNIDDVVEKLSPYVTDSIWIGKMNFLLRRLKMNGHNDKKSINQANKLIDWQSDDNIHALYERLSNNSKIKWKESIKKVVNISLSDESGLDI